MTSAIGWYGPLIDLSKASSHIGDFVQLLVFIHRCTPVQYKLSKGGEVIRTDIQVGDDTLPFFSVSLWQKQMSCLAVAGDVVLLQNVKVTKFGGIVDAKTVQFSSLQCLIHPYESLVSKGVDKLTEECRMGTSTMEKLVKVIKWVQKSGSFLYNNFRSASFQNGRLPLPRNWKVPERSKSREIFLLSEVSQLKNSCKAIFSASVGEIFLPITWRVIGDSERESMFVSRRITKVEESNNLVEDFTCVGCQLCGSPLDLDDGSMFKKNSVPLLCTESSDHLHVIGLIYRPFMLHVWDESEYLLLLVKNKAAELLFGNIKADKVYHCYRGQKLDKSCIRKDHSKEFVSKADEKEVAGSHPSAADGRLLNWSRNNNKSISMHLIWLIVLKLLLRQGKNSPLKFEVNVNSSLDSENGRFEMVSMSLPMHKNQRFF